MCVGANSLRGTLAGLLLAAMLCSATTMRAEEAPPARPAIADETADTDAKAEKKDDKGRRDVARKVAAVSLILILVLIIFVVTVMIVSRRMRARYLGWHRKIRFSKLWDVWWSKDTPEKKR